MPTLRSTLKPTVAPPPPPRFPAPCSFDHGPVHVIVLDSSGSNKVMSSWLEGDLSTLAARPRGHTQWLIVVVHHAPYSKGSEDCDTHRDQT